MPDISIIVPIYNVEKHLRGCIDGILAQTYANFELILVNDGSPDKCGEICDEYKRKDPRIKVIHQNNQGTGMARNNGMALAAGKYIYFCDPDDFLSEDLLAENFGLAERYNVNLVIFGHHNVVYKKNKCRITELSSPSMFLESKEEFRSAFGDLFSKDMMYTLWNKLYKKEFLLKNDCLFSDQKVGEDSIFNYKVYEQLERVYVNEKKYYYYFINRSESLSNLFRDDKFEIRYNETMNFEHLLTSWGKCEEYKDLLVKDWMMTVLVGINNLFNDKSPYKDKEKKLLIRQMMRSPKIALMVNETQLSAFGNPLLSIQFYLLKKNLVETAFYFFKMKRFIKEILT